MLTPTTLISLACLISNGAPGEQEQLAMGLSNEEVIQVERVIQSGACLPENFEAVLKKFEGQAAMGSLGNASQPTRECF